MQRACAIFASVACSVVQYFSTSSHERHDFRGGGGGSYWTQNVCFDFPYNFCPKCFSFYADFSEILQQIYICLRLMYSLFLSGFNQSWNFSTDFRQILEYEISWKCPVGAELFHAERQAEGQTTQRSTGLAHRNVANAPKNPIRNDCTHVGCSLTLGPICLPGIYY